MSRKFIKFNSFRTIFVILLVLLAGYSNASNTTLNIQQFANDYFNNHSKSEHFTATSITAQCGNSNLPITAVDGQIGVDDSRPLNTNSIFQIGSITKSFIAVILLQLENEQRSTDRQFSLNDTIGKWFRNPDGTQTYPLWQNITIRQLFNMTSGIPNYVDNAAFWLYQSVHPYEKLSPEFVLSYSTYKGSEEPIFKPGSSWYYDDSDYFLLGILIKKVTNKNYGMSDPIQTEIKNRITDKLNLHNTYYVPNIPTEVVNIEQLVHGYAESSGGMHTNIPDGTDITLYSLSAANAAGAIISSTEDINKYARALYTDGILLNSEQLTQLVSLVSTHTGQPIVVPTKDDILEYGLGIMSILVNDHIYYWYAGISAGFEAVYFYDPITLNTAVMAINSTGENPMNGIAMYTVNNIMSYLSTNCK